MSYLYSISTAADLHQPTQAVLRLRSSTVRLPQTTIQANLTVVRHNRYRATTRVTETGNGTADRRRLEITTLTENLSTTIIAIVNESCANVNIVSSATETESITFSVSGSGMNIDRSAIIEVIAIVTIGSGVRGVIGSIVSVVREAIVREVIVMSVVNEAVIVAETADGKVNAEGN